jgi:transglutaminase-like putative cysteine protease
MKNVNFQYRTELRFSSAITKHRFLLKISPQSNSRQQIKRLFRQIEPMTMEWQTQDGFGNAVLSGSIDAPHDYFRFGVEGEAQVSGEPYTECSENSSIFLYNTELTKPGNTLMGFYNEVKVSAPNDILERVQHFSHSVHERLRYERGVTANSTTAQEAFNCGAGVCQDFSHILLTLLRMDKIPCRYVAGLASDYGETHAWVEAQISAGRFCGVDPTRDKLIDEGYIALSHGRDFKDCSVERGVFKGTCWQTQTINLEMEILQ